MKRLVDGGIKMGDSKYSENKLTDLNHAIRQVERIEDEFSNIKHQFEASLGEFHTNFRRLSVRNKELIGLSRGQNQWTVHQELEEQYVLDKQVDQYVNDGFEQLSQLSNRVRKTMDEEREYLIRERNRMLWE